MRQLLVLFVALLLSRGVLANIELQCPCELKAESNVSLTMSFKMAALYDTFTASHVEVSLFFSADDELGDTEFVGVASADWPTTLRQFNDYTLSFPFPAEFFDGVVGQFHAQFLVIDTNNNVRFGFTRKFADPITVDGSLGSSSGVLMYNTAPEITSFTDSGAQVAVPRVYNSSGAAVNQPIHAVLALEDPNTGYMYQLLDQVVSSGLAADGSIAPLVLNASFNLAAFESSFTDLVLYLVTGDLGSTFFYYDAVDLLKVLGNDGALVRRELTSTDVDLFNDDNANGVSDLNEAYFGLTGLVDAGAQDVVTVDILGIASQQLQQASANTYQQRVEYLVDVANQTLSDNGINVAFNLVSLLTGLDVPGAFNVDKLQAMGEDAAFSATVSAYAQSAGADAVVLFDSIDFGDDNCGIAYQTSGSEYHNYLSVPYLQSLALSRTVVDVDLDCDELSFLHEMGHLLGLGHSRRQLDMGINSWAVGYGEDSNFSTVMSYDIAFNNAPKVPVLSSPDRQCSDTSACGVAYTDLLNGADAKYALGQTARYIAALDGGFQPAIALSGLADIEVEVGQVYSEPGFTVFDREDGDLTAALQVTGSVDTAVAGVYEVLYDVVDSQGNTSQAKRVVTVVPAAVSHASAGLAVMQLQDMNGDGIAEVGQFGLLNDGSGMPQLLILDPVTSLVLNTYSWPADWSEPELHRLDDRNNDGFDEVALYGKRVDDGRMQLAVKSGATGAGMGTWSWPDSWIAPAFLELRDLTGDGLHEYAIFGRYRANNVPQLVARDGSSKAEIARYKFTAAWTNEMALQWDDLNNDGIAEVAMYGEHRSNGKTFLYVVDGNTPDLKLSQYNWPAKWSGTSFHLLPDLDGDGIREPAVFGVNLDDGRPQLQIKKGDTKLGVYAIYNWLSTFSEVQFYQLSDQNGDGINDFGVLAYNSANGKRQLMVKNGVDRTVTLASYFWPDNWDSARVTELDDLTGDGLPELGLLGKQRTSGLVQMQVKDRDTRGLMNTYTFSATDMTKATVLNLGDIDGDGTPDIGLYDNASGTGVLEIYSGKDSSVLIKTLNWAASWY